MEYSRLGREPAGGRGFMVAQRVLIHFIMRADRKQKNRFAFAVGHKLEDNAKVITCGGCPITSQVAFEFSVFSKSIESIVL